MKKLLLIIAFIAAATVTFSQRKISTMTPGSTPLTGAELMEMVQGGATRSTTTRLIADLANLVVKNTQTADYPLVLADANKWVVMNSSSPLVVTIPLNATVAFQVGTIIPIERLGTGTVTVQITGGGTLTSTSGAFTIPESGYAFLTKDATNTWKLYNGPAALTYTAFTPTLTGFASTTLNTGRYVIEGKKCTFEILIAGTAAGSSPTTTITNMPAIAKSIWPQQCIVVNNATTQTGRGDIGAGTTVLTVWATVAQGNFTSSVARQIYINGTYEIQ